MFDYSPSDILSRALLHYVAYFHGKAVASMKPADIFLALLVKALLFAAAFRSIYMFLQMPHIDIF